VLRVVVDPNVVVSAAITPDGTTGRVVRAGLAGRFRFLVCPQLLDELRTVLLRPSFRRYVTVEEVVELVKAITGAADHEQDPAVRAATRDPGDDYLVALAAGANADRLVSGDPDLLEFPTSPVKVSSPRDFLDELENLPTD
jgi:putative PIN family toxin of toxin-antitoxin system